MTRPEPPITLYGTPWCGKCARLKITLRAAGIAWRDVDLEQRDREAVPAADAGGRRITAAPTVEFADGTTLVNPTIKQIQDKLRRR